MKVILLAGGFGTRLSEYTDTIPKPMVKIGDKPILWHIMNLYAQYKHKSFFIALGYKGEVIKEYLADGTLLNGTGTVVDFDATLIQLTYKLTGNAFDVGAFVKGDDSGAVGKITTSGVTTERLGVHHYESDDGIIVGRSHTGASAITNETFENNENEKKREIMMLETRYLQKFEQNFEELMNA